MSTYKYEKEGLFIALISYPFNIDGKNLFDTVFLDFFNNHINHLRRCSNDDCQYSDGECKYLYRPTGYRLVGGQGLAVLSLIDDYAFASRVFNQAHIDDFKDKYGDVSQCKAVVLTGSSEIEDEENDESHLLNIAKDTFLETLGTQGTQETQETLGTLGTQDNKLKRNIRYPFIGILRLKVDSLLLKGKGLDLTRGIK